MKTALRYLTLVTASNFYPFISIYNWISLALFVTGLFFSAVISIFFSHGHCHDFQQGLLIPALRYKSVSGIGTKEICNISMQTFRNVFNKILLRKLLKIVGKISHPCPTLAVMMNHFSVLPLI